MKTLLCISAILAAVPVFGQGNGIPQGLKKLYSLQIIAFDGNNCPQGDFIDTSRRQIAVKADVGVNHPDRQLLSELVRENDILLAPGDFQVIDGNACKDGVAKFQLPDPATAGSTDLLNPTFSYAVWLRLVGKPGTGVNVATCAVDTLGTVDTTDDIVRCSVEQVELTRAKGKNSAPKFTNVSKELLSICADTSLPADGICDIRVPLFSSTYYGYWWDWGTIGKAHAQLVFTEAP